MTVFLDGNALPLHAPGGVPGGSTHVRLCWTGMMCRHAPHMMQGACWRSEALRSDKAHRNQDLSG